MKKNANINIDHRYLLFVIRKILLMTKLTLLLICIAVIQLNASVYSQNTRLSFSIENGSVKSVLDYIENHSEFRLFYEENIVNVDRKVSLDVNEKRVEEILEVIFKDQPVSWNVLEKRFIILTEKKGVVSVTVQQPKIISGHVSGQDNDPIAGATILIKGTTIGTITDGDGNFKLNLPENSKTLVFSFIGMITKEVDIKDGSNLKIVMEIDRIGLEEVVAVGYGTQRKKDLTGAVSRLDMDGKDELPFTNTVQALRGTIAGVNVNMNGHPGDGGQVTIRGLSSLSAGNAPLFVVDGIPLSGSLGDINPNDIQSIDVLKDGSSAAVYGAKSASGVILITTKRGTSLKPTIAYNFHYGKQNISHKLKVLDGPKYIQKIIDYQTAVGVVNPDPKNYLQNLEYENYSNGKMIDPVAFAMQDAPLQTHDLSVSGKNERTTYYMSGSYTDEKGIVYNDNFKRISLRTNVENKITDWLSVGLNSTFSNRDMSGDAGNLQLAVTLSPYSQMYDDDGNPLKFVHGGGEAMAQNPIWDALHTIDLEKNQNLTGNIYAEVEIPFIKGLSYRLNYSNTFNWSKRFHFSPPYYGENQKETGAGYKQHSENYNWLVENIVKYKKHFAQIHDIDVTLLYSRDHYDNYYSSLNNGNFSIGLLGYNSLEIGTNPSVSSAGYETDGISMMGRIQYRLKDRYVLNFLTRRDGYSAFGKGNKFGVFPSMGLSWIVSEENFFKNVKLINSLKLRYSYGSTGNQAISPYNSLAQMGQSTYVFGDGSSTYIGLYNKSMANDDLSWETSLQQNVGLDFEVFKKRLSGSFEYYFTKTRDLLMTRSIPVMNGYTTVLTNLGGVQNKGFELTLNSYNIEAKDFKWNSTLTFSTNKNKITSLYGLDLNKDGKEDDDVLNNWFIGQPIGAIYDYTLDGIYQTGDNIPTGFKPGYFRIVDINNSGKADSGDRSIIGKTSPDFRIGLGNTWSYKNLSLFVFVNSSFGGMKSNPMLNPGGWFPEKLNLLDAGPYWTLDNPSTTRPTIGYGMPYPHGFYESLTYVRIQDVSLSYDLPKSLIAKAKINSLKVYVSAKNLATFTKWSGWDPEIDGIGTAREISRGGYPMIKTFVAGLTFSF